jgi:prepilin peptidase CpaA
MTLDQVLSFAPANSVAAAMWTGALMTPIPLLVWAACSDFLTRLIPDTACIGLALAGVVIRGAAGPRALGISVGIACLVFVGLAVLNALGGLGGGDVKLASATLVGLSPPAAYSFLVVTVIGGGVLAAIYLALRSLGPASPAEAGAALPRRLWRIERWRIRRHGTLPYGIALACGGSWAILTNFGG